MNILQQIEKLEREIKQSTKEMNQAEGVKQAKINTLKKEFDILPKQVAGEKKSIGAKLEKLGEKIETKFRDLKEEYQWEE